MNAKFWIPVVLAATFSTAALAHGDDRRDWRDDRRDDYRYEHRHHHHMPPPPPPAYERYDDWRPHHRYYERPAYYPGIPLPPPPHVILRELFR